MTVLKLDALGINLDLDGTSLNHVVALAPFRCRER